jgi:hypothetical protein
VGSSGACLGLSLSGLGGLVVPLSYIDLITENKILIRVKDGVKISVSGKINLTPGVLAATMK